MRYGSLYPNGWLLCQTAQGDTTLETWSLHVGGGFVFLKTRLAERNCITEAASHFANEMRVIWKRGRKMVEWTQGKQMN